MQVIQIFDPAMCCSSGVCGAEVDQALVTFASDVDWASRQGTNIERFNLANQPQIFADQPVVRSFLQRSGQSSLPLTLVNGEIALAGRYPTREELAQWTGQQAPASVDASGGSCCSGGKCC